MALRSFPWHCFSSYFSLLFRSGAGLQSGGGSQSGLPAPPARPGKHGRLEIVGLFNYCKARLGRRILELGGLGWAAGSHCAPPPRPARRGSSRRRARTSSPASTPTPPSSPATSPTMRSRTSSFRHGTDLSFNSKTKVSRTPGSRIKVKMLSSAPARVTAPVNSHPV